MIAEIICFNDIHLIVLHIVIYVQNCRRGSYSRKSFFCRKLQTHDVILMSFLANLSYSLEKDGPAWCKIDAQRVPESLVTTDDIYNT